MSSFTSRKGFTHRFPAALVAAGGAISLWSSPAAHAVIVFGGHNAAGVADNSGRNLNPEPNGLEKYVGNLGSFLGTPIAPRYFVTAVHVDSFNGSTTFDYANGTGTTTTYNATKVAEQNDLAIWKITDSGPAFSLYAPLYTSSTIVNQPMVTIGRGVTRGAVVQSPNSPNGAQGWMWGNGGNGPLSWGTNNVTEITADPTYGNLVRFTFSNNGNGDEGGLADHDSGGPTFVKDPTDQTYKLAGVNLGADGSYSYTGAAGTFFSANIYDARGLYIGSESQNQYINPTTAGPVVTSSYSTDLTTRLGFINSVTGVPEPTGLALCAGAAAVALLRRRGRAV